MQNVRISLSLFFRFFLCFVSFLSRTHLLVPYLVGSSICFFLCLISFTKPRFKNERAKQTEKIIKQAINTPDKTNKLRKLKIKKLHKFLQTLKFIATYYFFFIKFNIKSRFHFIITYYLLYIINIFLNTL